MSGLNITIQVKDAAATATVEAMRLAVKDAQGMHGAIAVAVGKETRDHLTERYLPRDKNGLDFWADVIRSITTTATAEQATVALNELGIALRYYGGDVTPGKSISSYTGKPTRALAIPSSKVPASGGRQIRPGRAGLLAFIRKAAGGETVGFLVEGEKKTSTKGKNKGKPYIVPKPGGSLLYTLRTITRHKGDKDILPSEARLVAAASAAIRDFVDSYESAE